MFIFGFVVGVVLFVLFWGLVVDCWGCCGLLLVLLVLFVLCSVLLVVVGSVVELLVF